MTFQQLKELEEKEEHKIRKIKVYVDGVKIPSYITELTVKPHEVLITLDCPIRSVMYE